MTLPPELQAMTVRNYPEDWTDTDTRAVDTARVLAQAPWTHPCDPIEGFILHDVSKGRMINEG